MAEVEIIIAREPVDPVVLELLAREWHGSMVKGVADLEREILALGGDWHMDANNILMVDGSEQKDVWGFNVYPEERGESAIEYISLINIRPSQNNRGMELEDIDLRARVRSIVARFIPHLEL